MENKPIEVFIFCWYPDEWLPRAVIVDYSKFDDKTKDDIKYLAESGSLIESVYDIERYKGGASYTLKGYKSNNKMYPIEENERLNYIISTWTDRADKLYTHDPDFYKNFVNLKRF